MLRSWMCQQVQETGTHRDIPEFCFVRVLRQQIGISRFKVHVPNLTLCSYLKMANLQIVDCSMFLAYVPGNHTYTYVLPQFSRFLNG
jgi:hypothetical protein